MQNVRNITQNASHTIQNDGCIMQNVVLAAPHVMLAATNLYVCQRPKGGLKKLKCLEMIFRTLGT